MLLLRWCTSTSIGNLVALKLEIYENLVENNINLWYNLFQLIAYLSL
jgi:hypothetical protein